LARSLESTQASIEAALAIFRTRIERDAWLREQGLEEDRYQDGTKLPRAAGEGV
jgi:hypothetical protein